MIEIDLAVLFASLMSSDDGSLCYNQSIKLILLKYPVLGPTSINWYMEIYTYTLLLYGIGLYLFYPTVDVRDEHRCYTQNF